MQSTACLEGVTLVDPMKRAEPRAVSPRHSRPRPCQFVPSSRLVQALGDRGFTFQSCSKRMSNNGQRITARFSVQSSMLTLCAVIGESPCPLTGVYCYESDPLPPAWLGVEVHTSAQSRVCSTHDLRVLPYQLRRAA